MLRVTYLCYSLVKKEILAILRFSLNYVVDSVDLEKSWKIMMMTETQRMVVAEGLLTAATSIELEHPRVNSNQGVFSAVIKLQMNDVCKWFKFSEMSES